MLITSYPFQNGVYKNINFILFVSGVTITFHIHSIHYCICPFYFVFFYLLSLSELILTKEKTQHLYINQCLSISGINVKCSAKPPWPLLVDSVSRVQDHSKQPCPSQPHPISILSRVTILHHRAPCPPPPYALNFIPGTH